MFGHWVPNKLPDPCVGDNVNRRYVMLGVVLLAAAVGPILLGWFAWRAMRTPLDIAAEAVQKEERTVDHGAVVTQIRELARLETAAMRVMHVSTIRQSYGIVPQAISGDEMTFVGVGDVIAGIDLGDLRPEDVVVDGRTAVVRLPTSQVLVTRLDNEKSHVANRSTGVLRRSDPALETRIRQTAEKGIREEALRRDILGLAERNAETRIATLLRTLGFEQVTVTSSRRAGGQG